MKYGYKLYRTTIDCNESVEGESLEREIEKIVTKKEQIDATAPAIYTERKDGVLPQYDMRTDRFDLALSESDRINRSIITERDNLPDVSKSGDDKKD